MLNLEHEAKTLISAGEFANLLHKYQLNQPIIQRNIYLETRGEYYRKQGGALRIRSYNDERFELTLKLKNGRSNDEYNLALTTSEFKNIIKTNNLPEFQVPLELKKPELQYTTITKRHKLPYQNYIIEIDETLFETTTDYEIEVEAESIIKAEQILNQFINENSLELRVSKPKIARYFDYNPKN